jgi:hypothetical protein
MKTQAMQNRRTIDNAVSDASRNYVPGSRYHQPQDTARTKYVDVAGYHNHFRTLRIKFLDSYMGIPQKGDPRRKEYLAILSN